MCGFGGEPGGHYGNIKDSDPFVGPYTGTPQQNWLVLFESPALTYNDAQPANLPANDNAETVRSEAA